MNGKVGAHRSCKTEQADRHTCVRALGATLSTAET